MRRRWTTKQCVWLGPSGYLCRCKRRVANANADRDRDRNCNGNRNGDGNSDADGNRNGYIEPKRESNAETSTICAASSHTAAPPVIGKVDSR